VSNIGVRL